MRNRDMKPAFIGVVAVLLVILGVVIGVSIVKQNETSKNPGADVNLPENEKYEYPKFGSEIETFVIMGVDSRENQLGKGTRSDSIMVVVLDHDKKTVRIASLLRDCYAYVEGYGFQKLNHANYYGGPRLALSTIKDNFDLNIKDYVQVNFASLEELVDGVGGIEMELTWEECEQLGSQFGITRFKKAGTHVLSGEEALAYSRLRKLAGEDRARSERQRSVLFALFDKAKTMTTDESVKLVSGMIDKIKTSFGEDEIMEIMYYISRYKIVGMEAFPLVYYDGLVGESWHEVPTSLIDMNTDLYEFLYDYTEYKPSKKVEKLSEEMSEVASEPNMNFRD